MTTIRAVVEYEGTEFSGMQFQPRARTVAGELERVFSKLLRHPVKITAAGRTDAGVHATGQVVSFKTERVFPFDRLAIASNSELDGDVRILSAAPVAENFSARFSAAGRTYVYALHNAPAPSALTSRYAYHVWHRLDLPTFNEAANKLVGEHDFRSFCGSLPQNGPTVRTVREVRIDARGTIVRFEISADGFLHRMVRTIVGTLIECAAFRRDPQSIIEILEAKDRRAAGFTAPGHGLYLAGVRYADGFDSFSEPPVTQGVLP